MPATPRSEPHQHTHAHQPKILADNSPLIFFITRLAARSHIHGQTHGHLEITCARRRRYRLFPIHNLGIICTRRPAAAKSRAKFTFRQRRRAGCPSACTHQADARVNWLSSFSCSISPACRTITALRQFRARARARGKCRARSKSIHGRARARSSRDVWCAVRCLSRGAVQRAKWLCDRTSTRRARRSDSLG